MTNPGDGCFVDEWAYNRSLAQMRSIGVIPIPVKINAVGLDPDDLRMILQNWDESEMGCLRSVLLIVFFRAVIVLIYSSALHKTPSVTAGKPQIRTIGGVSVLLKSLRRFPSVRILQARH